MLQLKIMGIDHQQQIGGGVIAKKKCALIGDDEGGGGGWWLHGEGGGSIIDLEHWQLDGRHAPVPEVPSDMVWGAEPPDCPEIPR